MGPTTYSKEEQLGILERPLWTTAWSALGQQLIAARLNIAAGASAAWPGGRAGPGRSV